MNHYTYMMTTENLEQPLFYIGVRSSKTKPENDIDYKSSSKLVEQMIFSGVSFKKEILFTYNTREEAELGEQQLFDEFDCVNLINCINIHSNSNPYTIDNAKRKIRYFKSMIPQWNIEVESLKQKVKLSKLTLLDLDFVIRETKHSGGVLHFSSHPEFYKEYFMSTGAITFYPGRQDNLMSVKKGKKKFYKTDLLSVVGSPEEIILELLEHHYVSGQTTAVLQYIETLKPYVSKEFMLSTLEKYTFPQNKKFVIDRLKYYKNP